MRNYLNKNDQELFYKIHKNLLFFVNQKTKFSEALSDLSDWGEYENFMSDAVTIRNHLFKNKYLIDQFIEANPVNFTTQELSITKNWNYAITGNFILLKHLKYYSVFLDTECNRVYGVLGLIEGIDEAIPSCLLPIIVNTTLIPFSGKIVYDGMLHVSNVILGNSYVKSFTDDYSCIKEKFGIITSFENGSKKNMKLF